MRLLTPPPTIAQLLTPPTLLQFLALRQLIIRSIASRARTPLSVEIIGRAVVLVMCEGDLELLDDVGHVGFVERDGFGGGDGYAGVEGAEEGYVRGGDSGADAHGEGGWACQSMTSHDIYSCSTYPGS